MTNTDHPKPNNVKVITFMSYHITTRIVTGQNDSIANWNNTAAEIIGNESVHNQIYIGIVANIIWMTYRRNVFDAFFVLLRRSLTSSTQSCIQYQVNNIGCGLLNSDNYFNTSKCCSQKMNYVKIDMEIIKNYITGKVIN